MAYMDCYLQLAQPVTATNLLTVADEMDTAAATVAMVCQLITVSF